MLYRLLRPDEDWQLGLSAKFPNSTTSVFEYVSNGSWGSYSKYISTCGSLNSVLSFRSKSRNPRAQIVQISEENLEIEKIDLRPATNRMQFYINCSYSNKSINTFNNFARVFEEVLLVGHVPASHIQPMKETDFVSEQLPV
jgi:hypothetical protein